VSRSHLFAVQAAIGCSGDVSQITACPAGTWQNLRFCWNESAWFMSPPRSRLPLRLYLCAIRSWIAIRFLLRQHPVRCFGQMPSDSSNRLLMPSSTLHPLVQTTDMSPRVSPPMDHHRVGGLCIRPLQVVIDIRACASVSNVPSAGVHSRRHPGIRCQIGSRLTSSTSVRMTTPRMNPTPRIRIGGHIPHFTARGTSPPAS